VERRATWRIVVFKRFALRLAPGVSVVVTFRAGETLDALAGEWCVDWQGIIIDSEGEPGQER